MEYHRWTSNQCLKLVLIPQAARAKLHEEFFTLNQDELSVIEYVSELNGLTIYSSSLLDASP